MMLDDVGLKPNLRFGVMSGCSMTIRAAQGGSCLKKWKNDV